MSNPEFQAACLSVRLDAVVENYRRCARLSSPAAVAPALKADAYGLGALPIAKALAHAGADSAFVARIEEGIALRPQIPQARIFVLDGAFAETVPALIAHGLTPVLNSLEQIEVWSRAARTAPLEAAIHVDTGMNRLGMPGYELATLSREAKARLAGLRLVLVMSHLACSDDPSHPMNREQLGRFREALAMLPPAPASLAASAGILLGRDYAFDLVRPGIGLYGGNPRGRGENPFAVAAQLTGRILQTRRIDKGESVGYAASFRSARPTVLATVALGYADGIMRAIGNRGAGAVGGVAAPVVGRVSMDAIVLDLGPHGTARAGDRAEIFGDTISLEVFAEASGTTNYEILTRIAARVPRHYVGGAAA